MSRFHAIKDGSLLAQRMNDARQALLSDATFMLYVSRLTQGIANPLPKSPADMKNWYHSDHERIVDNVLHPLLNYTEPINETPMKGFMESLVLFHPSRAINYFVGLIANNVAVSTDWYGRYRGHWINQTSAMIKVPPYPTRGIIRARPSMSAELFRSPTTMTTDASIDSIGSFATGGVIILPEGSVDMNGVINRQKILVRCGTIPILGQRQPIPILGQPIPIVGQPIPIMGQQPRPLVHPPMQPIAKPIYIPRPDSTHPLDNMMVLSELQSLLMGLELLNKYYPDMNDLNIFVDCLDVKRALQGVYSIPEEASYHTFMEVIEILRRIPDHSVAHIFREQNMVADRIAHYARRNSFLFTEHWDNDWKSNEQGVMRDIDSILRLNPLFREMIRFDDSLF